MAIVENKSLNANSELNFFDTKKVSLPTFSDLGKHILIKISIKYQTEPETIRFLVAESIITFIINPYINPQLNPQLLMRTSQLMCRRESSSGRKEIIPAS